MQHCQNSNPNPADLKLMTSSNATDLRTVTSNLNNSRVKQNSGSFLKLSRYQG